MTPFGPTPPEVPVTAADMGAPTDAQRGPAHTNSAIPPTLNMPGKADATVGGRANMLKGAGRMDQYLLDQKFTPRAALPLATLASQGHAEAGSLLKRLQQQTPTGHPIDKLIAGVGRPSAPAVLASKTAAALAGTPLAPFAPLIEGIRHPVDAAKDLGSGLMSSLDTQLQRSMVPAPIMPQDLTRPLPL